MLNLVIPTKKHEQAVIEYKEEMAAYGSSFDGCGGLEKANDYNEWLKTDEFHKRLYGEDAVPSHVFLGILNDNRIIGMIEVRYELTDFLLKYGGNIGYSVRPTERRKGYAVDMLVQLLTKLQDSALKKVLLCCDPQNTASKRVIEKCGGVFENTVADEPHLGNSGEIKRYWIDIELC
jgi:predicted acetyltransferase